MKPPEAVQVASPAVVLDGIDLGFLQFIGHLAIIHMLLFAIDLVITSGKDGHHVSSSMHPVGKAIDVRTKDKDPAAVALFLHVLAYAAIANPITVFDERNCPTGAHIHIEWHG